MGVTGEAGSSCIGLGWEEQNFQEFPRECGSVSRSELLGFWCPAWSLPWQDKYTDQSADPAALAEVLTRTWPLPLSPSPFDLLCQGHVMPVSATPHYPGLAQKGRQANRVWV